jgi:aromatic ring-cleaving dioxygenase
MATEAHEMLQKAFKEEALSRTQVLKGFARFKRGEMSIEVHPHSGRPSTSRTDKNIKKIREKINEDRRYTIDKISEATGVS